MVTVERFQRHEDLDEDRYKGISSRFNLVESNQSELKGYIKGRTTALGVALAIIIPLLSWIVNQLALPHVPVR